MKQYVGISRDHSGSMSLLREAAMKDYNVLLKSIQDSAKREDLDTMLSTVICDSTVTRETVNRPVEKVKKITSYSASGSTPLFDSVGELITILEAMPDANEPAVNFLIMVVTDGQENSSHFWRYKLPEKIKELQATDKWTFTFRVPYGYKRDLVRLGIPEGNIVEWEQTEEGMRRSTMDTVVATSNYFTASADGGRMGRSFSSKTYYADLAGVGKATVKGTMTNISSEVRIWEVPNEQQIRPFVENKLGRLMSLGTAFYQLTKAEKAVQDYKLIVIRSKGDGAVYAGKTARDLLGLPTTGSIKLAPGDHGGWEIYIQSTSVNRKLVPGTKVLYWEHAGKITT